MIIPLAFQLKFSSRIKSLFTDVKLVARFVLKIESISKQNPRYLGRNTPNTGNLLALLWAGISYPPLVTVNGFFMSVQIYVLSG